MRYKLPNTFTDRSFYLFDTIFQWANKLIKAKPSYLINIETIEDGNTLVMDDSTLVSALSLEGHSKTVSTQEFISMLDKMERRFGGMMTDGSHYFSFYFMKDSDGIEQEIEKVYGGVSSAEENIGLNLSDIIQEQKDVLGKYCHKERCLILLWSNRSGMSKDEKKQAVKERIRLNKGLPKANLSQNLGLGGAAVLARHKAFVSDVADDFKNMEMYVRLLDSHELLREVRMAIDPRFTANNWSPSLPGDKPPLRMYNNYKPDFSNALWPSLKSQLFPRAAEQLSHSTIKIGGMVYAPVTISLMPKSPEPFQALFSKLNKEDIPWRINSLIRNDGLSVLSTKEIFAGFMQYLPGSPENKYIIQVKKDLIELRDRGEDIIQIQITLCTWAPEGEKDLLDDRRAKLARVVSGWGNCEVAPAEGDPLESAMSSTPCAVMGSIGVASAAPIYEALKMAPLTRQASAWASGSQPFRTLDGKILPYQPYSKLQTAWTTLIFGPMGYGKSMFMNNCNLSLCLNEDNAELPYISIIDIGPSSRGLISLLRGALPKEKSHLVMYERLQNTVDYAINPFDTRLGLRKPLSNQKSYLVNLICYLSTSVGDVSILPEGVSGMVDSLVDLSYSYYGDRKTMKNYEPEVSKKIDQLIEEMGMEVLPGKTRWWDVVDFFYMNEMTHEAGLAQRYAVPTVVDIASLCRDERLISIYGHVIVPTTNETVPTYVWRKLTESINAFPIIANPTRFDLGEARVVSLDLDEVTKGSGATENHKTGLMYMAAYHVLTSHFFTGKEHIAEMDSGVGIYNVDYRPYHEAFSKSIKKLPKRFCIDEKHRVKGLTLVEEQLDRSIREGRKWKVEIMQASQQANDFSESSVNLATNVFILGGGNKQNCKQISEVFNLSETMQYHLINSLRKPNKTGATLLSIIETDKGVFEQLMVSSQGPTFLWACNSSSDDAYVRDRLYREIGDVAARTLLVKLYPAGNLDSEIERRKRAISLSDRSDDFLGEDLSNKSDDDEGVSLAILDAIADDAMVTYRTGLME